MLLFRSDARLAERTRTTRVSLQLRVGGSGVQCVLCVCCFHAFSVLFKPRPNGGGANCGGQVVVGIEHFNCRFPCKLIAAWSEFQRGTNPL
jgi:hypothetical protein